MFCKPKQKFEISFQQNISEQLSKMSKGQLFVLLFAILKVLPLSFQSMAEYKEDFITLFEMLGSVLSEGIRKKIEHIKAPNLKQMAEASSIDSLNNQDVYISALLSGLGGCFLNKKIAGNIIKSIFKVVDPEYESHIGWRDAVVIYVKTHSKAIVSTLTSIGSFPTY